MSSLAEGAAFAAIVALAIWLRLPGEPPALLWLDEAWRVRQALEGGVYGVLLLSEKLFVQVGFFLSGMNEAAFRIWPIIGTLLAMAAVSSLRGAIFRTPLWLWVCLTYALAGNFVMHSREFKPYGMDLGLTLASVATAVAATRSGSQSLNRCMVVSGLTAAATAVFPFVHAGTSLFLLTRRRFSGAELAKAIVVPGVVFLCVYVGFLSGQTSIESTTKFWAALYLTDMESVRRIAEKAWTTGPSYSLLGAWPLWLCTFVLAPVASLWRRDGFWALLLGPFLAQVVFAAAGKYPLFDRPSYYFYGLAALAVPYTADVLLSFWKRENARVVLAWILLVGGAGWLAWSGQADSQRANGLRWPLRPDARVVLEILARDYVDGDRLFLNDGSVHTFALYAPAYFPAGSPLRSQETDWRTVLRNRSITELCSHLMLRAGDLEAGQTVWFASAHTGYAARYYNELLRRVGKVEILVDERAACLVRVRLDSPMRKLQPLCQEMWDRAFPKK
ncbi:MAG: hypothetical protein ABR587_00110 [Candidatus Binatia bacterium]